MKQSLIRKSATSVLTASAIVLAVPSIEAEAKNSMDKLVNDAINAGTVLKWAISVEGFADFKTRPYDQYNIAKKAILDAEQAINGLSTSERLSVQAKLVEPKTHVKRAQAYIDAITSSEKIMELTSILQRAIDSAELSQVESVYHSVTAEYRKQTKLLDRVYGQSTRAGIRDAVKPSIEQLINEVKYDVTVKMHLDKAKVYIVENKLIEAGIELEKANYYLSLNNVGFTFKNQLEQNYSEVLVSLPLIPLSATSDGKNTVTISFSKVYSIPLEGYEAGQFKISGETVQSGKLSEDKKSVILTTSDLNSSTDYTVTWKGKTIGFTTAKIPDTSGITINEKDIAFIETKNSRTYTANLTNTDGTPYIGRVKIRLDETDPVTTTTSTSAVITALNGPIVNPGQEAIGNTDTKGNLVFTVAAANHAVDNTASVTYVQPTIIKLDGNQTSKIAPITHFYQLQNINNSYTLSIENRPEHLSSDYIYTNGFKYKWDSNDYFFIQGQIVTQEIFENALSKGDSLSVDYKINESNASSWNLNVNMTQSADLKITNPIKSTVTYDGSAYDISGTAEPGNNVHLYRNDIFIGMSKVAADGNWSLGSISLLQNFANTFKAYQYAAGRDGVNGEGSENQNNPATITINEGAFAASEIVLNDQESNGLSYLDTLDFKFINPSYDHEFKKELTGTITINDGLGNSALVIVDYVDEDSLKIVDFITSESEFDMHSSIFITDTKGIVNQDQLEFNVSSLPGSIIKL